MTIQPLVPTGLPWVYDLIVGQEWPQGDEDALRRCAQAWTEALGALLGIAEGGDVAAQVVGYSVQAVSSDEFDRYWSRYTKGDNSVVGQMAQQCQQLAEILLQDAEQVEFTKLSINIQVVILAIQLTIDIATAIVTAGSSMAEGAAAAAAARFTVKKLLMELLKGALLAAAPDFITQTIMLAEGHRSSYNISETLQAASQGALGAGIGMAVGGVTGRLASSLTGSLGEDAGKTLGGKLLTGAITTGNAAITGALTNMVTTGVTDLAAGQSLDNVWSAGANGAANGLLFHGTHALGEGIGESMRPEPTPFILADGRELHGLPLKDGSFALFDQNGMKHGTGWYDPQSGQLSVRPVSAEPYRVPAGVGGHQGPAMGHGGAPPEPRAEFASLGAGPSPRADFVPWKDRTPRVGTWNDDDENWQRIADDPERFAPGMSTEQIIDDWHNGKEPPTKVTRKDLLAKESDYLDKLPDQERRVFHDQLRVELEKRHRVVKARLEQIRDTLTFGEFRGEDHYRKLAESMDEKLDKIPGLSFKEFLPGGRQDWAGAEINAMALDVNDPLRYTMVFDDQHYSQGAHKTLRELHAAGYRLLDEVTLPDGTKIPGSRPLLENDRLPDGAKFAKNFWRDGNRYLGMNITLVDPDGGHFELQFHTPESFDVKQYVSHRLYDIYRSPEYSTARRVNALMELIGLSDRYLNGHIPGNLDDFAPRSKDAGVDKLFGDLREDVQKQIDRALTPDERAGAEQQMAQLAETRHSLMQANREEIAEHLQRLGREEDLTPEEVNKLFGETVDLVKAGQLLNLDLAETRRGHFRAPVYEPPAGKPGPAREAAPDSHGAKNDTLTGLGPSPHGAHEVPPAGPQRVAHLTDPIRISPDHLAFQMRDEYGNLAFAHLERINGRWVLHTGGGDSATLSAIGENLRTTAPGLDLIGHASADGFVVNGHTVPFEDVLAHIPDATTGDGPIRLIACDAGGGAGRAAQRLANLSGREVIAADTPVWVARDGSVLASNPVDRAKNWYPRRPADGVWSVYEPGGDGHARPIHPGSPDEHKLPSPPRGWDSGHDDTHPEFTDLAYGYKNPAYSGADRRRPEDVAAVRELQASFDTMVKQERREGLKAAFRKQFGIDLLPRSGRSQDQETFVTAYQRKFEAYRRNILTALDIGAPPQTGFDPRQLPEHGITDDAAELARQFARQGPGGFADAFRREVAALVDDSVQGRHGDEHPDPGQGVWEGYRRPFRGLMAEIFRISRHPLAPGEHDFADFAGIPVDDNGAGNPKTAPDPSAGGHHTKFFGTAHQDPPRRGKPGAMRSSYGAIEEEYRSFVGDAAASTGRTRESIDREFSSALHDLLRQQDPVRQRAGLEALAKSVYGDAYPGFGESGWEQTRGGRLLRFGATLGHLIAHIEVGRNPEAITNLMAIDLAARGRLSMTDAFAYFNIMTPPGAAALSRIDRIVDPGVGEAEVRSVLAANKDLYKGYSPYLIADSMIEFRSRRFQVLSEFAVAAMERPENAGLRAAFHADPAGWLSGHPEFVLEQLAEAFEPTP